ncbi:MFS multidrug transporter [Ramaria rubella]|nr:MFS multidrug transporter [Ramaria rubella]
MSESNLELPTFPKPSLVDLKPEASIAVASRSKSRGWPFWLAFSSLCMALMLSALDLTAVSTILPVIANDLGSDISFIWIGSAYALASTAFLTLSGQLSHVFGRRPIMLACLIFFAVGSAVCGAARSMRMMAVGRTIQGVGGGGIASLASIVVSDMVPLRERGKFQGIYASIYAFAGGIGPVIGGAFAKHASWRWLFYLNLPICGIALVLVALFMHLPTPFGNLPLQAKLRRIDWIGNTVIIGSTTACMIAVTWGGVTFPWSSPRVLVPLCLGLVGLAAALVYELKFCSVPTIPPPVLNSVTAISGYFAVFLWAMVVVMLIFYLPVYYQAIKLTSTLRSGVLVLSFVFVCPVFSMLGGVSVVKFHKYRLQNLFGWICLVVGLSILCTFHTDDALAKVAGVSAVLGVGAGLHGTTLIFPLLAPVPVKQHPFAVALYIYVRSLGQSWGIAIGGTILQNQVGKHLPTVLSSLSANGGLVEYSAIPLIPTLGQPEQDEVRTAFMDALNVMYKVMVALAALGLVTVFLSREIPLTLEMDEERAFRARVEKGVDQNLDDAIVGSPPSELA